MLFHITATHTEDNCPGYNRELMPPMLDAIEASGDLAKELGLNILFMVSAAPKHASYILMETEDSSKIGALCYQNLFQSNLCLQHLYYF